MNAAHEGHACVGLGYDGETLARAGRRARRYGVAVAYEVQDLRRIDERTDLVGCFDVAVCTEVLEHILDDRMVLQNLAKLVREGGKVLLTTPHAGYRPIDRLDSEPFLPIEDGRHVRKGYDPATMRTLCEGAGLEIVEIGGCSGYGSQMLTKLLRWLTARVGYPAAWAITLLLRPVGAAAGFKVRRNWPQYTICVEARRPMASPVVSSVLKSADSDR